VILDWWDLQPGDDNTVFLEQSVLNSMFVLGIRTPEYAVRINMAGGVGYDAKGITEYFARCKKTLPQR
jgi:hypothetical protein